MRVLGLADWQSSTFEGHALAELERIAQLDPLLQLQRELRKMESAATLLRQVTEAYRQLRESTNFGLHRANAIHRLQRILRERLWMDAVGVDPWIRQALERSWLLVGRKRQWEVLHELAHGSAHRRDLEFNGTVRLAGPERRTPRKLRCVQTSGKRAIACSLRRLGGYTNSLRTALVRSFLFGSRFGATVEAAARMT